MARQCRRAPRRRSPRRWPDRLPEASVSHYSAAQSRPHDRENSSKPAAKGDPSMSGNVTEILAGFAASLQYDDIPERARESCKALLLDTLACAVAGHKGEETGQVAALAAALAQSSESSVIGGD